MTEESQPPDGEPPKRETAEDLFRQSARLRDESRQLSRRLKEVHEESATSRQALKIVKEAAAVQATMREEVARRRLAESRLAAELHATRLLQRLSSELIREEEGGALYERIVETAQILMRADATALHLLDPRTKSVRLLATKGFHPPSTDFWPIIHAAARTATAGALRAGDRVLVPDVRACNWLAGSLPLEHFELSGIRALQSTPLVSRTGEILGHISTHWHTVFEPTHRDLGFLDLLARQAADVLERRRYLEALRESQARLEEADRRKNDFLAMVGHELRNPLAAIRSGVALLQSDKAAPASRAAALPVVAQQVAYVERLVEDLLDLTRIVQGRIHVRREPMVLQDALHRALAMLRAEAEAGGFAFETQIAAAPLEISGDLVRLTQVFVNLLGNALRYSGDSRRIEISLAREDSAAVARIRDYGIGIPPGLLPRIFDPFVQAKPGVTLAAGLGLGLAVVRQLVQLHDGTVTASSAGEQRGSEFVLRLPLLAAGS